MPPILSSLRKPDAAALFTDRVDERALIDKILAPISTTELGQDHAITVFYGISGSGKSSLCNYAKQLTKTKPLRDQLTCVYVNFDTSAYTPSTNTSLVVAELCRSLQNEGVKPTFTTALLALQHISIKGSVDERWAMVRTYATNGVESVGLPGLGLLINATKALIDSRQRASLQTRLTELGLWPIEKPDGQIDREDLEKKLGQAVAYDAQEFLKENPERHIRLFLDGFERLQGPTQDHRPAQWHVQAILGYLVGGDDNRVRVLIFGREKLRWDEIYQDRSWPPLWNQHLLGSLSEKDALDFLGKCASWHRDHGQGPFADFLVTYESAILDATDEKAEGQRGFNPYHLNFAVEVVADAFGQKRKPDLGRTPHDLQSKFLHRLDPKDKRALQVLALSETFDEQFFNWLCIHKLIGYEQHTFHSQLRQERCYFQAVQGRQGEWRLQSKMEELLQASWEKPAEGQATLKSMLQYYAEPLTAKPERDWGDAEFEAWRRGMEIIVSQGPEGGDAALLPQADWETLLATAPWSVGHFLCTIQRLDFTQRILTVHENFLGSEHPDTLKSVNNLAIVLKAKGDYAAAEPLYRRALAGREKALGPEHPDTLMSVAHLAGLHRKTQISRPT